MKQADPKGRVARWVVTLQEFDYEVLHKAGVLNVVADAMSRAVKIPEDRQGVDDLNEELPDPLTDFQINRLMPGAPKADKHSRAVLASLQDKTEKAQLTRQPRNPKLPVENGSSR